jgi:predicted dehydrogenase
MTSPLCIAVVGLGARCASAWLPLLLKMPQFQVVGLYDTRPQRIDAVRREFPELDEVPAYPDWQAALGDSGSDAMALTVRSRDQGRLAAEVLEAGKHVHAEVPAAHSIEDCWRIVLAAERTGSVYALAEQTRYWGFVQEWKRLVDAGCLGDITYVEGQYFHHLVDDKFADPETGDYIPLTEAGGRASVHTWQHDMPPIHYLPHELSPMLAVLNDRVVEVVGMSSGPKSRAHPEIHQPDLQVALMRTAKGAILRMAASFAQPHPKGDWHWYQIVGTRGRVEWRRSADAKPKLWLAEQNMRDLTDAAWRFERTDAPPEASGSGHGDADYYAHLAFLEAINGQPPMDVYTAVGTAAPAILAAESIELGSALIRVPDFRPGAYRAAGEPLEVDS